MDLDPILTVSGMRVGGVRDKYSPIVGAIVAVFFGAIMCSSTTRSAPRSSRQGMPSGETIGPRPGAHPMNWPSGS